MSIVLWEDGAKLRKTGNKGTILSMVGMLMDLGPRLRSRLENLITLFHVGKWLKTFLENNLIYLILNKMIILISIKNTCIC